MPEHIPERPFRSLSRVLPKSRMPTCRPLRSLGPCSQAVTRHTWCKESYIRRPVPTARPTARTRLTPVKRLGPRTNATFDDVETVTKAIQGVAWSFVLFYAYSVLVPQSPRKEGERACETCGGTGVVECFCTRWSDGDARGCGSCGGSLNAACHSCRGGGTAVPIEARVLIRSEKDYN